MTNRTEHTSSANSKALTEKPAGFESQSFSAVLRLATLSFALVSGLPGNAQEPFADAEKNAVQRDRDARKHSYRDNSQKREVEKMGIERDTSEALLNLKDQSTSRLRILENQLGLINPHTFEGTEGLKMFRSMQRYPITSPEARAERFAVSLLERFEDAVLNPHGQILPPSPLIFGKPSNIAEVFRSFANAQRKLSSHESQITDTMKLARFHDSVARALRQLEGNELQTTLSRHLDTLINDFAVKNPIQDTAQPSPEEMYVKSKLPRVFVHEIVSEFEPLVRLKCQLKERLIGDYPPADARATLALLQRSKSLLREMVILDNDPLAKRVITSLEPLEAAWKTCVSKGESELASKEVGAALVTFCHAHVSKQEFKKAITQEESRLESPRHRPFD